MFEEVITPSTSNRYQNNLLTRGHCGDENVMFPVVGEYEASSVFL